MEMVLKFLPTLSTKTAEGDLDGFCTSYCGAYNNVDQTHC